MIFFYFKILHFCTRAYLVLRRFYSQKVWQSNNTYVQDIILNLEIIIVLFTKITRGIIRLQKNCAKIGLSFLSWKHMERKMA